MKEIKLLQVLEYPLICTAAEQCCDQYYYLQNKIWVGEHIFIIFSIWGEEERGGGDTRVSPGNASHAGRGSV